MIEVKLQPWWFCRLAEVKRWCIVATTAPESVAEHTCQVAGIALWIYKQFNLRDFIDKGAMLEWALMHDMAEIFTGDIATPMKRKIIKQVKEINSKFYEPPDENTLLVQVVKIADMAQTIIWLDGNGKKSTHVQNVQRILDQDYHIKIEEMKKMFRFPAFAGMWDELKNLPDNIIGEMEW